MRLSDLLKPHIPLLIPDETGPFSWIPSFAAADLSTAPGHACNPSRTGCQPRQTAGFFCILSAIPAADTKKEAEASFCALICC